MKLYLGVSLVSSYGCFVKFHLGVLPQQTPLEVHHEVLVHCKEAGSFGKINLGVLSWKVFLLGLLCFHLGLFLWKVPRGFL